MNIYIGLEGNPVLSSDSEVYSFNRIKLCCDITVTLFITKQNLMPWNPFLKQQKDHIIEKYYAVMLT